MASNGTSGDEPAGELLSRAVTQKWLCIPREALEAIAEAHPEICYRKPALAKSKRWFRKSKVKEILLGQ